MSGKTVDLLAADFGVSSGSIAQNIARRHLDSSQLSAVAARCRGPYEEEAAKRQEIAGTANLKRGDETPVRTTLSSLGKGKVVDLLATDFGVSSGSITKAIAIDKQDPKQLDKVLAGELTVSKCYNAMKGKKSERTLPSEDSVQMQVALSRSSPRAVPGPSGAS